MKKLSKKKIIIAAVALCAIVIAIALWLSLANSKTSKDKEAEFKSIKEVTAEAKDCAGKKYQNLTMPKTINVPQIDKAHIVTVTSDGSTDPVDGLKRLCKAMSDVEPTDIKMEDDGATVMMEGQYLVRYYSANSFLYAKSTTDPSQQWAEYSTDPVEAVYDLENDDLEGVSYDFSGKPYSVADAAAFAEKEVNEKLLPFFPDDSQIKAKELIVYKSEERGHYYYVAFEHYIDDLPRLRSGTGDATITRVFPSRLDVHIHNPDELTVVNNYAYTEVIDKKPVEKIMSLQAALEKMEKELAPEKMYKVEDVRLEYVAVDTVIGGGGNKEYHPTWCLIINNQPPNTIYSTPKELLLCDAVTGDIMRWNDLEDDFVFGAPKPTMIRNEEIFTDRLSESIKNQYGLTDGEFNALIEKEDANK